MNKLLFCPHCMVELTPVLTAPQMECPSCGTCYPPYQCGSSNMPGARCQLPGRHLGTHIWDKLGGRDR
jgi:hypothetical protein